jgi:hypothetical protein
MKNPQILDLYSDYLIASFNFATATGLSELLDGALSHDQISRFLGQSLFTQQDYWKCVKPLVRRVEHPDGVIKIDDTILEKPHSTENEIICWHWDHSLKPKAGHVKGVNILNFLYQSPLGSTASISIPVAFEIVKKTEPYFDKKSGKVKMCSPITKNEMARERLRILHHYNKVKFRYVLWDSWFSSDDNFEFVHYELKKYFVAALKDNRLAALSMEDKLAGKFHQVKELGVQKDEAITVWLKGLDFPVLLTRQVFTNKDGSTGELYLVTNDLELTAQAISATYQDRWGVEVFHKSLKQEVGLEKSPTKHEVTQSNHVFAAMIAWTKMELLRIKEQSNHAALKTKLYVKALKAAYEELQMLKELPPKALQAEMQSLPNNIGGTLLLG